ncbi:MAG: MarR family winged helix-turn-helix transcriptional regulator [Candidatus Binatia bacterium]
MVNLRNQTEGGLDYQAMAQLRYEVRRFLRFSENVARAAGLEPQQHQLLLAVKGLPPDKRPTISVLAERMQLQHHSAVELIDRLALRGFVRRYRSRTDRRQVFVRLTESGEEVLRKLSLHHLHEYKSIGPALVQVLNSVIASADKSVTDPPGESESEVVPPVKKKKAKS